MAELLDSVLSLYQGRLNALDMHVEREYDPRDGPVLFCRRDPPGLRQPGRQLPSTPRRAAADCWSAPAARATGKNPAQTGVRFTVADTGAGMEPEVRKRAFEAFFTTKEVTGTGLGLWVSHEIIAKHRGLIHVRSRTAVRRQEPPGTVFQFFIPDDPGICQRRRTSRRRRRLENMQKILPTLLTAHLFYVLQSVTLWRVTLPSGHDPAELGELERSILLIVWRIGAITAEQVREDSAAPSRTPPSAPSCAALKRRAIWPTRLKTAPSSTVPPSRGSAWPAAPSNASWTGSARARSRPCWSAWSTPKSSTAPNCSAGRPHRPGPETAARQAPLHRQAKGEAMISDLVLSCLKPPCARCLPRSRSGPGCACCASAMCWCRKPPGAWCWSRLWPCRWCRTGWNPGACRAASAGDSPACRCGEPRAAASAQAHPPPALSCPAADRLPHRPHSSSIRRPIAAQS